MLYSKYHKNYYGNNVEDSKEDTIPAATVVEDKIEEPQTEKPKRKRKPRTRKTTSTTSTS